MGLCCVKVLRLVVIVDLFWLWCDLPFVALLGLWVLTFCLLGLGMRSPCLYVDFVVAICTL